jgi:hypothetical protein
MFMFVAVVCRAHIRILRRVDYSWNIEFHIFKIIILNFIIFFIIIIKISL